MFRKLIEKPLLSFLERQIVQISFSKWLVIRFLQLLQIMKKVGGGAGAYNRKQELLPLVCAAAAS